MSWVPGNSDPALARNLKSRRQRPAGDRGRSRFVVVVSVAACVIAGGAALSTMLISSEKPNKPSDESPAEETSDSGIGPYPYFDPFAKTQLPGVEALHSCPGADAQILDDDEVIGVVVAGQARAYLRNAMDRFDGHVVNDLVGDKPVTVTYCDVSDCARAFTDDSVANERLDVWLGGQDENRLLLLIGEKYYFHDGDKVPLQPVATQRMTWSEWRNRHPTSEVYTGALCQCKGKAAGQDVTQGDTKSTTEEQ